MYIMSPKIHPPPSSTPLVPQSRSLPCRPSTAGNRTAPEILLPRDPVFGRRWHRERGTLGKDRVLPSSMVACPYFTDSALAWPFPPLRQASFDLHLVRGYRLNAVARTPCCHHDYPCSTHERADLVPPLGVWGEVTDARQPVTDTSSSQLQSTHPEARRTRSDLDCHPPWGLYPGMLLLLQ